jgi:hypothetical protein
MADLAFDAAGSRAGVVDRVRFHAGRSSRSFKMLNGRG